MKKQKKDCFKECKLSICNGVELESDGMFMSENIIKDHCDHNCSAMGICITICNKLKKEQWKEAELLLSNLQKCC